MQKNLTIILYTIIIALLFSCNNTIKDGDKTDGRIVDSLIIGKCSSTSNENVSFEHINPKLKINNSYILASGFQEGRARVLNKTYKMGLINKSGDEITPCIYDIIFPFKEYLARVQKNNKWGYVDIFGKEVVRCIYDYNSDFSEGLGRIKLHGKWGFVDENGTQRIPCIFDKAIDFSEGLCAVLQNGKWGYIDKKAEVVIPMQYESAFSFYNGVAFVQLDGKYGIIDSKGKIMSQFKYIRVQQQKEGVAIVKTENYDYILDVTTHHIYPFNNNYDIIESFHEGMARVCKNGMYGFINIKGKEIIPCKYNSAGIFSEGLCRVSQKDSTGIGYINKMGELIIPYQYMIANDFSEGLACVVNYNGKMGFIDQKGRTIIPFDYDCFEKIYMLSDMGFHDGLALILLGGKWGYIDKMGNCSI